jgi:hypothetical protein
MKFIAIASACAGITVAAAVQSSENAPTTPFQLVVDGGNFDGQTVKFVTDNSASPTKAYAVIGGTTGFESNFKLIEGGLYSDFKLYDIGWAAQIPNDGSSVFQISPSLADNGFAILQSNSGTQPQFLAYNSSTNFFTCANPRAPYPNEPVLAFRDTVGECTQVKVQVVSPNSS